MKNLFANLSTNIKGILLIVGGSVLVLNYFGFIEILDSIIALGGVVMIIAGIMMTNLHEKVYSLVKKENKPSQDERTQDERSRERDDSDQRGPREGGGF